MRDGYWIHAIGVFFFAYLFRHGYEYWKKRRQARKERASAID
jgi:hypothetical protein